jgi:hypothetical protein
MSEHDETIPDPDDKLGRKLGRSEMSHCWRCLKPAPNDNESDAGWTVMELDDCFVHTCPDCFDPDGYTELDEEGDR